MSYPAFAVANTLIERSKMTGVPLTPLKLQKVMYFLTSEYAKETGGENLMLDNFQAWAYGPVVPAIYQKFKPFRANPITGYATDSQGYILKVTVAENPAFERTLNRVWDATANKTPTQLVTISQADGSAWSQTWNDEAGDGDPIPFEAVKNDSTYKEHLGL